MFRRIHRRRGGKRARWWKREKINSAHYSLNTMYPTISISYSNFPRCNVILPGKTRSSSYSLRVEDSFSSGWEETYNFYPFFFIYFIPTENLVMCLCLVDMASDIMIEVYLHCSNLLHIMCPAQRPITLHWSLLMCVNSRAFVSAPLRQLGV